MKIGDLVVGAKYGAVDEPSKNYQRTNPRQVKVLEIVTVPEEYWGGGGYATTRMTRNVRRVVVQFLDEAQSGGSQWGTTAIKRAAKDSTLTIEARKIVAKWSELSPGIHARIREEQADAEAKASTEKALREAGFGKLIDSYDVRIHSRDGGQRIEVEFHGPKAVKLMLGKVAA